MRELQNVNASTTVEELQSARDDVADARNAAGDAAEDLREARGITDIPIFLS